MSKRKQKFDIVGNDFPNNVQPNTFTAHHLVSFSPKTPAQEQFFRSYFDDIPVIMQVGSAGTGKSACALYAALSDVLHKDTPYDKVVVVRSAAQTREIGFLPGGADGPDSKMEVFEAPYKALCDELLAFKSQNYDNLKAKRLLEFHSTSFLRGITFDRSVIIVDEFQSMNYHELATIITRVGIHSRIVFCGDFKQNDLHKKNDKSGFHEFMKVIDHMDSVMYDVVNYTPDMIVRSGICKEFLLAEERADV